MQVPLNHPAHIPYTLSINPRSPSRPWRWLLLSRLDNRKSHTANKEAKEEASSRLCEFSEMS